MHAGQPAAFRIIVKKARNIIFGYYKVMAQYGQLSQQDQQCQQGQQVI